MEKRALFHDGDQVVLLASSGDLIAAIAMAPRFDANSVPVVDERGHGALYVAGGFDDVIHTTKVNQTERVWFDGEALHLATEDGLPSALLSTSWNGEAFALSGTAFWSLGPDGTKGQVFSNPALAAAGISPAAFARLPEGGFAVVGAAGDVLRVVLPSSVQDVVVAPARAGGRLVSGLGGALYFAGAANGIGVFVVAAASD